MCNGVSRDNLPGIIQCIFYYLVHTTVFTFYRYRTIHLIHIIWVDCHPSAIAHLQILRLMEMSATICQKCLLPCGSRPFAIIIIVRFFILAYPNECDYWSTVFIHSHLPDPIPQLRIVHNGRRESLDILFCRIDTKYTLLDSRKFPTSYIV